MGKIVGVIAGVLMLGAGIVWTGQGLGYIEGSSMSGQDTWAIVGPLVAGLGVALLITVLKPKQQ